MLLTISEYIREGPLLTILGAVGDMGSPFETKIKCSVANENNGGVRNDVIISKKFQFSK